MPTCRIAVVTTSRADLSPLLPVMRALNMQAEVQLQVIVTGMHLLPNHGAGLVDLAAEGFAPAIEVPTIAGFGARQVAESISRGIEGFAAIFEAFPPDMLVVLGDRYDMLPAVLAALPFRIPVTHLHGGEVTTGAFDDAIRHAVTKLSHLHCVATEDFAKRLIRMGEDPDRVFVAGAPGLDNLRQAEIIERSELSQRARLPADQDFTLATLHPETLSDVSPARQAEIFADAADAATGWLMITQPNADPGGDVIAEALQALSERRDKTVYMGDAGPRLYPSLLRHAACVIGNSSSGIIEAGFFGRPVLNIGKRQSGRPRGANVIDVGWSCEDIVDGWRRALDPAFGAIAAAAQNPYGHGNASERIAARVVEAVRCQPAVTKHFYDLSGN